MNRTAMLGKHFSFLLTRIEQGAKTKTRSLKYNCAAEGADGALSRREN
jgi:hypothetical protein